MFLIFTAIRTLSNRRTFVVISERDGLPDGLVVDSDGCVWVALFGSGRLRRYSPFGKVEYRDSVTGESCRKRRPLAAQV